MEIEFDLDTIRRITAEEYSVARREIQTLGVLAAYQRSRQRHDDRIATAPDVHTLACGAGCFWCCYFTVDVRAIEAFAMVQFMDEELPPAEQARIRQEIEANSKVV